MRRRVELRSASMPMMDKTLEREIAMAKRIQQQLLNGKRPALPFGELSGVSIPARNIGGDYYDFYPLSHGRVRILIGDVMGKGIPAAMVMILTRGAFRSAAERAVSPGETLEAMNNALYDDLRSLGSFVTVLCADWDPTAKRLVCASAGHSLPLVVRPGREPAAVSGPTGVMLGGLPKQTYVETDVPLFPGDLAFFYTDGIVEALNAKGEPFRLQSLKRLLAETADAPAEDIQRRIVDALEAYTDGRPQKDDITMAVLKA